MPVAWYLRYETESERYYENTAHEKKGGYTTALTIMMKDGHTERVLAFPSETYLEYMKTKLVDAEYQWRTRINNTLPLDNLYGDDGDLRTPTYQTREQRQKHNSDLEKRALRE